MVEQTGEQHRLVGNLHRQLAQAVKAEVRVGRDEIEVPVNGGGHGGPEIGFDPGDLGGVSFRSGQHDEVDQVVTDEIDVEEDQPDLAVANQTNNTVSIRLGTGAGGFATAPDVVVGSGPASVAVGDFNGDGKQDLAVANATSNTMSIRLGTGSHPDLYVEKLSDEWLLPLCSPRLLEGPEPLRTPQDLRRFALIQVDLPGIVPTWGDWMQMAGIEGIGVMRNPIG